MELSNLQGQLKVAIQKHQITVTKMKSDPQNELLKKQLKEIQVEIVNINTKQKLVIANLKKELEGKQNRATPKTNKSLPTSLTSTIENQPKTKKLVITTTTENKNKQSITVNTGIQSQGLSFRVEKPSVTSTVLTLPPVPTAAQKIINQVVPTIVSNLVAAANSASNLKTAVLFPTLTASQTANLLNKVAISTSNQTSASTLSNSLLVVPSPLTNNRLQTSDNVTASSTTVTTTTASFVLKLGSPIRVPQYPPPNCRTSSLNSSTLTSTVDSCGTVVTAVENIHIKKEKKIQPLLNTCDTPSKSTVKTIPKVKTEDNTKMNFMTALGLINRDVLNELQSKRGERKRRTTANPQFSNAALEEKRKNAAALLSAAAVASNNYTKTAKKSRGKARLNTSPIQSPPPTPPPTTMPRTENGANIYISRNGTSLVITNTTTQCNSLDNLPVGAHHVLVKSEPMSSPTFSVDDNMPLNCSKKPIPPTLMKTNTINSKPVSSKDENNGVFANEAEPLIKTVPKNHILNGCLKTVLNKNGGILSEVVLCGICHLRLGAGSGDMLACIGCKRPYHTRCAAKVVPQIIDGNVNKNAHWKCPKCVIPISASTISSPVSTAISLTVPVKTSFTHHQPWKKVEKATTINRTEKIAKEEEKQKLLKRNRELNEEVTKLREKRQRLSEQHAASLQHQSEQAANKKRTEEKLNKMHETVNMVRSRSS